jgi:hippurate hydrolase
LTCATWAHAEDDRWVAEKLPGLVSFYKELHANPELSFHEGETAKRIAAALRDAGLTVTLGLGKTGVVGILANGEGPTVLVRTDLDALPVTEATGLPYASKVTTTDDAGKTVGVMHACGHDIHMTSFVGTARWLAEHKDQWSGKVLFVGQPAEERVSGARAMLEDGLYDRFGRPDFALALHVSHDIETGSVGYRTGPAMASSTSVDVVVKGKGGHGAGPHNTVDPIVLASLLVIDLQTIVSREVPPVDSAVVTVGSIQGGTKHNIIPDEVRLQLTLRAFKPEVRELLIEGIKRRADALARAHRAPAPVVTLGESTPPTINTPELVAKVLPAIQKALGSDHVREVEKTMGAEDFGLFGQGGVPTFMFNLGAVPSERIATAREKGETLPSLHSAQFAPDPAPAISTGVRAMTAAVVSLVPPKGR